MSPRRPSSSGKISREREILEKAAQLFSAQGYHATRMEDIAEATGVTKAALYYYYPEGKQQILLDLVRLAWELLADTPPLPENGSPEEVFETLLRHHARVYLSHPELFDVLFREAREVTNIVRNDPAMKETLHNLRKQYLMPYTRVLEGFVPGEELPYIMRAISGLVYAFLYVRQGDEENNVEYFVRLARRLVFPR